MGEEKEGVWFLEGFVDQSTRIWRTWLRVSPFTIGRAPESHLVLTPHQVSQQHAELQLDGADIWLRDCGSTNGTFVNGERLHGPRKLAEGDILHFAEQEFRIDCFLGRDLSKTTREISPADRRLPRRLAAKAHGFRSMLDQDDLIPLFQPVVRLADSAVLGYELLSRGRIDGEVILPESLFEIAEVLDREVELSVACRRVGMGEVRHLPKDAVIFLNVHPLEMLEVNQLVASAAESREVAPDHRLVLEIHESAVTSPGNLRSLRKSLQDLEIGLAFDDFGTGQARILELAEVAPDYLKFHGVWIAGLHLASRRRIELTTTLLKMMTDQGITSIAEGVEESEGAAASRRLGFDMAQGYHFGHPAPAASFSPAT